MKIRYNGEYFKLWDDEEEDLYENFVERTKNNLIDFDKECGIKKVSLKEE